MSKQLSLLPEITEDTEYHKSHLCSLMQYSLTSVEHKALTALLFIASVQSEKNPEKIIFTADLRDITSATGVTYRHKKVREIINKLADEKVVFNYIGKHGPRTLSMKCLAQTDIGENESDTVFSYQFPEAIRQELIKPQFYTSINMFAIKVISSKYTQAIYEFCKSYVGVGKTKPITIEELRGFWDIQDGEYPLFTDLERRVIKRVKDEINETKEIEITVEYEKIMAGKKVGAIQFFVYPKSKVINIAKSETDEQLDLLESLMPDFVRTEKNRLLLKKYLTEKGELYCVSNIQYTFLNLKKEKAYSAYLSKALDEDYGHEIRRRMELERELMQIRGGHPTIEDMDPRADRIYQEAFEQATDDKKGMIKHQLSNMRTSGKIKNNAPPAMQLRQAMQKLEIWL